MDVNRDLKTLTNTVEIGRERKGELSWQWLVEIKNFSFDPAIAYVGSATTKTLATVTRGLSMNNDANIFATSL